MTIAEELQAICDKEGELQPATVVKWAQKHPKSALHKRFTWDKRKGWWKNLLHEARQVIAEVQVVYPDMTPHRVYVSVMEDRSKGGGYVPLLRVLSDEDRRRQFPAQALAEYERVGERYRELQELAGVRDAVARAIAMTKRSVERKPAKRAGRKKEVA